MANRMQRNSWALWWTRTKPARKTLSPFAWKRRPTKSRLATRSHCPITTLLDLCWDNFSLVKKEGRVSRHASAFGNVSFCLSGCAKFVSSWQSPLLLLLRFGTTSFIFPSLSPLNGHPAFRGNGNGENAQLVNMTETKAVGPPLQEDSWFSVHQQVQQH